MKTIIAGSRTITDYTIVKRAIEQSGIDITEVVSGCARGVDTLGEKWARENNIPIARFPADWNKFGKGAGTIRNKQMAEYADALVAIWDEKSRGTNNMINIAQLNDLTVKVFIA